MTHKKDMQAVVAAAEDQGWRVEHGAHHKLYAPDGEHIVIAASTPSSARSVVKTIAQLRRYGFRWKGR